MYLLNLKVSSTLHSIHISYIFVVYDLNQLCYYDQFLNSCSTTESDADITILSEDATTI